MSILTAMVDSIDGLPTINQVDRMLQELGKMPRDKSVVKLTDDLLDYRSDLIAFKSEVETIS